MRFPGGDGGDNISGFHYIILLTTRDGNSALFTVSLCQGTNEWTTRDDGTLMTTAGRADIATHSTVAVDTG